MNPWRGRLTWLAIGVALGGAVYWFAASGSRHALSTAVKRGEVTYSATSGQAEDAAGGGGAAGTANIDLTVTRGSATGDLNLLLQAGVPISTGDGSQRLMTAIPVAIHIPAGQSQVRQSVETYCLDPFIPPPAVSAPVTLGADGLDESPDEIKAGKLTGCLKQEGSHGQRQLSIWLVAQGYLEKSYADVKSILLAKARKETASEIGDKRDKNLADALRHEMPGATPAQIQRQIDRLSDGNLAGRVEAQAQTETDDVLKGFLASRSQLQSCGLDPAKLDFFRTAPPDV